MLRKTLATLLAGGALSLSATATPAKASDFTTFESAQVRPLALAQRKPLLFAVNTPDGQLEIYETKHDGLRHIASAPVGLEPVAVAVRNDREVWVVNHLSDSVSILDVSDPKNARVKATLLVGDEPRDIVFAGPNRSRAFITTAHRGQNRPGDPQLTTPGVGRADVWVFDAGSDEEEDEDCEESAPSGPTFVSIVTLFSDTPRALAVSPDGKTVYAAAFHSGNKTTIIPEHQIPNGFDSNSTLGMGLPAPSTNAFGERAPETGLIVKHNSQNWVDLQGRIWDSKVKFNLPDKDVFAIDATANPPVEVGFYTGVGTTLFNMAVNPVSGALYVTNTEARNEHRFAGAGTYAALFGGETLRGHLAESRVTVLDNQGVRARHLNKHIDYSTCCGPVDGSEAKKSLAFPQDAVVSEDGKTLYVTAFGSSKIGVFDTAKLANDTFTPSESAQIKVSGGGPSGIALDDKKRRMYVLTRFDNSISVIDTKSRKEVDHIAMHNPEPESVQGGRPYLYDATLTSSHGDSACASCHIGGDHDALGWDVGEPDAALVNNPGPFVFPASTLAIFARVFPDVQRNFHPMKGPMLTQSLRGLANHGPMHWRGDRTGGNAEASAQPDSGSYNEIVAFKQFNDAFSGLVGRNAPLPDSDMQEFAEFALQITYPPNPIRNLDNSLTPSQERGRDFYFNRVSDGFFACNGCHVLNPQGNAEFGVAAPGFFGTDGRASFDFIPQFFKVPQLRNVYQRVGMFGMVFPPPAPGVPAPFSPHMGDQIRGYGFAHDGTQDTIEHFLGTGAFNATPATPGPTNPFPNPGGFPPGPAGSPLRHDVESFLLAYDSNLAPIVGQQVTLDRTNGAEVGARIDLLMARAEVGECDLVVQGNVLNQPHGFLYVLGGNFQSDVAAAAPMTDAEVRNLASWSRNELTYTCLPPGSGQRVALDRDRDGVLNGDERREHTDPADPTDY